MGGGGVSGVSCCTPAPRASTPPTHMCPHHLPGEVVKDVAAMGVEDGDGLSEVVPLGWREMHVGEDPAGAQSLPSPEPRLGRANEGEQRGSGPSLCTAITFYMMGGKALATASLIHMEGRAPRSRSPRVSPMGVLMKPFLAS